MPAARRVRQSAVMLILLLALPAGVGFGASERGSGRAPGVLPMGGVGAAPQPVRWEVEAPRIPWWRLITGTAAVGALICGGVYLLKRLNGGVPFTRGRYLEVIEARPIGRNLQLFLVRVADRVLLLAAANGNVARVAELDAEELPEADTAAAPVGLDGFRSLLKRVAGVRQ
ncbi:MAG: hypothetical protein AMK73_00820 [Planctomycetes bacterium SM23_32]|nr:MAG: hypothetical protein AMK73_00820 [Planctomycetes bacterium SM23_32]